MHGQRRAAGLAFWGLLLVAFDLDVGGFDLLSDPVGAFLCVAALGHLRAASPHGDDANVSAARRWWVVAVVVTGLSELAVLSGVAAPDAPIQVVDTMLGDVRPAAAVSLLELVLLPAQLALIAAFAAVVRSPRMVQSWATSRRLLLLVGVPVAVASAAGDLYLLATGRWFSITLGSGAASLALLGALAALAAAAHVLVSLHRTRTAPEHEPLPV
ncbi:hypothetical protein [Egicoccus sp. AB-alg6-2]|uniref:hypothetical protein n=1 Tax=Egicoccus sp. AB-alg6-2 TaxID=3242692 RepID=UPI00359EB4BF